jgi:Zn finger protein HypA/HybF involved in hydrogenase expression
MSAITKGFTKEQLQQIIETDHVQCGEASALARFKLASLEAEDKLSNFVSSQVSLGGEFEKVLAENLHELYVGCDTAPPAPASVPDEVSWEDVPDEITEDDMEIALAWAHGFNQCRDAMLQGAERVTKAYKLRDAVETIRNSGIAIDGEKILAERDALNTPDCWCRTCRPVTISDMRFVVCPVCGNKRCPHANDHRNACTGSNEPGQEGSAYPAAPKQEAK